MHQSPSHAPDVLLILCGVAVSMWAHLLADPWGTIAVIVTIVAGLVRLAINVREWGRGRRA